MNSELINISKLNKAEVLVVLYNNSKQQGLGFLDFRGEFEMSKEEAEALLRKQTYFNYLHGRVMKVEIEDLLDPRLYDHDNGKGAAMRALAPLFGKLD